MTGTAAAPAERGGLTLWLGSDDEIDETTVSGVDLYEDVPGAIRDLAVIRGEHPCEFYRRLGFRVVGLMPDANGPGKPDIFFAKRVGGPGRRHGASEPRELSQHGSRWARMSSTEKSAAARLESAAP